MRKSTHGFPFLSQKSDAKFHDCVTSESFLPIPAVCKFVSKFVEFPSFKLDTMWNSRYVITKSLNDTKSIKWTRSACELATIEELATAVLQTVAKIMFVIT